TGLLSGCPPYSTPESPPTAAYRGPETSCSPCTHSGTPAETPERQPALSCRYSTGLWRRGSLLRSGGGCSPGLQTRGFFPKLKGPASKEVGYSAEAHPPARGRYTLFAIRLCLPAFLERNDPAPAVRLQRSKRARDRPLMPRPLARLPAIFATGEFAVRGLLGGRPRCREINRRETTTRQQRVQHRAVLRPQAGNFFFQMARVARFKPRH